MTGNQRTYYGKVMLFGEYSVIEGSDALILPYRKVRSDLRIPEGSQKTDASDQSNRILKSFAQYLLNQPEYLIDTEKLLDDLNDGMYLDSTIPAKHGLGSSGAVCAAIFDNYGHSSESYTLKSLKILFAGMESFFHGKSSGADPLCIYLNAPLFIHKQEPILQDEERMTGTGKVHTFLIHGGKESRTDLLVSYFHEQMAIPGYRASFIKEYVFQVNEVIRFWVEGKPELRTVMILSDLQLHYFDAMIPHEVRTLWNEGLVSGLYALKICGSGGGGMMLGFTENIEKTREVIGNRMMIEWLS